jgi:hypothetical protein
LVVNSRIEDGPMAETMAGSRAVARRGGRGSSGAWAAALVGVRRVAEAWVAWWTRHGVMAAPEPVFGPVAHDDPGRADAGRPVDDPDGHRDRTVAA